MPQRIVKVINNGEVHRIALHREPGVKPSFAELKQTIGAKMKLDDDHFDVLWKNETGEAEAIEGDAGFRSALRQQKTRQGVPRFEVKKASADVGADANQENSQTVPQDGTAGCQHKRGGGKGQGWGRGKKLQVDRAELKPAFFRIAFDGVVRKVPATASLAALHEALREQIPELPADYQLRWKHGPGGGRVAGGDGVGVGKAVPMVSEEAFQQALHAQDLLQGPAHFRIVVNRHGAPARQGGEKLAASWVVMDKEMSTDAPPVGVAAESADEQQEEIGCPGLTGPLSVILRDQLGGESSFATLEEAVAASAKRPMCRGITMIAPGVYTLRKRLQLHPATDAGEQSWLLPPRNAAETARQGKLMREAAQMTAAGQQA